MNTGDFQWLRDTNSGSKIVFLLYLKGTSHGADASSSVSKNQAKTRTHSPDHEQSSAVNHDLSHQI